MIAVIKDVNNLESYVVVQELKLSINLALYVFCFFGGGLSLGNQYDVGSLS